MSERVDALPRWAHVCDVLALACVLLSVSISLSGGFRERTPLGVLSVTSAVRPLLLGVVFFMVRHAGHRRPWIGARAAAFARAWKSSPDGRIVWPVFLTTRFGVLIVGFLGVALLGYAPDMPPYRVYANDFLNLPARWDTGWYLGIAEKGYSWDPAHAHEMQNIAFFPAYPLAMRYGALFVARQRLWAGVIVSFVAFYFALRYLFRFARQTLDDDGAATVVLLLAAYPFAFFYSTAYTESLFLLAMLGACVHFERGELWKAGGWGLLAGLSRPNGCFLSIVLGLIALRDLGRAGGAPLGARLVAAAMPGIGAIAFSVYIFTLTGNPLQWTAAHAPFGRVYRGLDPIFERVQYVNVEGLYAYASLRTLDMLNAVPVLFALVALWPVYKRFGLAYAAMIALNLVPPVLMGGVLSMGRITSVLFPLFLWLGSAIPSAHRAAWVIAFSMLQALGAITFFTWRPLV